MESTRDAPCGMWMNNGVIASIVTQILNRRLGIRSYQVREPEALLDDLARLERGVSNGNDVDAVVGEQIEGADELLGLQRRLIGWWCVSWWRKEEKKKSAEDDYRRISHFSRAAKLSELTVMLFQALFHRFDFSKHFKEKKKILGNFFMHHINFNIQLIFF